MAAVGWQHDETSPIEWNCGGSLIRYIQQLAIYCTETFYGFYSFHSSYRFVLSAAHCASWRGVKPKFIRLGEQNLKRTDDGSRVEDYEIVQSIRHPNYRASSKYNDIALFQLDRDVHTSEFIKPACIWQKFDAQYTRYVSNSIATSFCFSIKIMTMLLILVEQPLGGDSQKIVAAHRTIYLKSS